MAFMYGNLKRRYEIFCVNGKYGIQSEFRIFLLFTFTE